MNEEILKLTVREKFILFALYNKRLTVNQLRASILNTSDGVLKLSRIRCLVIVKSLVSRGYLYFFRIDSDATTVTVRCTSKGKFLVDSLLNTQNKLMTNDTFKD